jgi:hypothetical protein
MTRRLERLLLSVMGPPQVGDPHAPSTRPIPEPAACPRCSKGYDEHQVVRDRNLTWSRCPD